MGFLDAVGENLLSDIIWLALGSAVVVGLFRVATRPILIMTLRYPRSKIRFSTSALLRVKSGSGFVLTITPQRGESPPYWGPLGGVVKCRHHALDKIHLLDVQPDWLPDDSHDMDHDLRVRMRGYRFLRFMYWYWRGKERESPTEAVARELKEELGELGLESLVAEVDSLEYSVCPVKSTFYREGELFHFRLFYVIDATGPSASRFEQQLLENLAPGKLALISEAAIKLGRDHGTSVGGHSAFLIPGEKYVHRSPSYQ